MKRIIAELISLQRIGAVLIAAVSCLGWLGAKPMVLKKIAPGIAKFWPSQ